MKIIMICILFAIPVQAVEIAYDKQRSNPQTYQAQAKEWVRNHLAIASDYELQLTANLMYLAWLRSYNTIKVQTAVLSIFLPLAQNLTLFTHARLNPGQYVKYQRDYIDIITPLTAMAQALATHRVIGSMYTHAVNALTNNIVIESPQLLHGINKLRIEARRTITTALGSAASGIQALTNNAHTIITEAAHLLSGCPLSRMSAVEAALNHLTSLIMASFTQADLAYSQALDRCVAALKLAFDTHGAVWQLMEEVRGAYYAAYYTATYELMTQRALAPSFFGMKFDEEGMLPSNMCTTQLPTPASLFASIPVS